jgi:LysR family nitrogen assimilation transcriptional regulator
VGDENAHLRVDTPVPLSRLGITDLILPGRPNTIRTQVENAVQRAGFTFRGRIEAGTLALCLELTQQGLGYTILPYSGLAGRLHNHSGLTAAPIKGLRIVWMLCVNQTRTHSVAVRQMTAELRRLVELQIKANHWPYATLSEANPTGVSHASGLKGGGARHPRFVKATAHSNQNGL